MPPAAQQLDWSGLKVAAIALGNVQEAARRAAINLPPVEQQRFIERVNKRSQREGWMVEAKAITATALERNAKPLSNTVQNGSTALVNHLEGAKQKSRFNLSKFVVNASKVAARSRSPLQDAQNVRHVAAVAAQVWPEEQQKDIRGLVSVALIRLELPANQGEKTVQAKVIENEPEPA